MARLMTFFLIFGWPVIAFADDHCKPSKWGADDELGAANYVTPAQVLNAASLI